MTHGTPSEADVADTLSKLELSSKIPQTTKSKPKSAPVADSWEEASSGSDTETETLSKVPTTSSAKSASGLSPINTTPSYDSPNPPPPTPASPTPFEFPANVPYSQAQGWEDNRGGVGRGRSTPLEKRPEKTTAVAGRLIAAGLGVRAPKRTEEEREYDKAMKEKVRKQRDEERNRERMEREQAEARKRAVWED